MNLLIEGIFLDTYRIKWIQNGKVMSLFLLFVIINSNGFVGYQSLNPTVATGQNQLSQVIDVDLGILQEIEISEQFRSLSFDSRFIELESSVFTVLVALKVQNSGDELKKISAQINHGENEWERVFNRVENNFEVYYDFSQESDLIIPLKGFSPPSAPLSKIQVNLTLEYYPSLDGITAVFSVIDTKIRHVLNIPELEVLIFPETFHISLPAKIQPIHRIVLGSYYVTKLPQNSKLIAVLQLETELQIESPELIGTTMINQPESNEINEIAMVLDKNLTKIGIKFRPNGSRIELPHIVKICVMTTEKQTETSLIDGTLNFPDHPIPAEVMTILLPLFLFGVPLIVIYKHRESETGKKIQKLSNK